MHSVASARKDWILYRYIRQSKATDRPAFYCLLHFIRINVMEEHTVHHNAHTIHAKPINFHDAHSFRIAVNFN